MREITPHVAARACTLCAVEGPLAEKGQLAEVPALVVLSAGARACAFESCPGFLQGSCEGALSRAGQSLQRGHARQHCIAIAGSHSFLHFPCLQNGQQYQIVDLTPQQAQQFMQQQQGGQMGGGMGAWDVCANACLCAWGVQWDDWRACGAQCGGLRRAYT